MCPKRQNLKKDAQKVQVWPRVIQLAVMLLLTLPMDDMFSHTLHCFLSNMNLRHFFWITLIPINLHLTSIRERIFLIPGKLRPKAFNKSHSSAQRRQTLNRALVFWIEYKFSFRIVRRSIDRLDCGDEKWRQIFMMIIGKCHRYLLLLLSVPFTTFRVKIFIENGKTQKDGKNCLKHLCLKHLCLKLSAFGLDEFPLK